MWTTCKIQDTTCNMSLVVAWPGQLAGMFCPNHHYSVLSHLSCDSPPKMYLVLAEAILKRFQKEFSHKIILNVNQKKNIIKVPCQQF